jgi:hypothetical protein
MALHLLATLALGTALCALATLAVFRCTPGRQLHPRVHRAKDRLLATRPSALLKGLGVVLVAAASLAAYGAIPNPYTHTHPAQLRTVPPTHHHRVACMEDNPCWDACHGNRTVGESYLHQVPTYRYWTTDHPNVVKVETTHHTTCYVRVVRTGFDSPLHHSMRPHLIHRCPKLNNPVECTGKDSSNNQQSSSNNNNHTNHDDKDGADYTHTNQHGKDHSSRCRRYRVEYVLRHPVRKPTSLAHYVGCDLWAADHQYHATLGRGLDGARALHTRHHTAPVVRGGWR